MGLRYSGQPGESSLTLINTTTQEQLLPSMALESVTVTLPLELVEKNYIGEVGPDFREFGKGYEVEFKMAHTDAGETVALVNAIKAKAEGKSVEEFALQTRYFSPGGATYQITLRDLHFEGIPFELGGRTDFLMSTIKAKGKNYKVNVI